MGTESPRSTVRHAACVALALLLVPLHARAQTSATTEPDAATLFARAREHMRDGRWAVARDELAAACQQNCSPAAAYNLALAERALGHIRASLTALERYEASLREHPSADGQTRASALRRELDASLARVEFVCQPATATIAVDGVAVASSSAPLALDPGTHTVRAEAVGYEAATQVVSLSAGETRRVELALRAIPVTVPIVPVTQRTTVVRGTVRPPPPPPRRGLPVPWIVGGIAGGVAITVATLVVVFVTPAPPYEGSLGLVRFGPSGAQ